MEYKKCGVKIFGSVTKKNAAHTSKAKVNLKAARGSRDGLEGIFLYADFGLGYEDMIGFTYSNMYPKQHVSNNYKSFFPGNTFDKIDFLISSIYNEVVNRWINLYSVYECAFIDIKHVVNFSKFQREMIGDIYSRQGKYGKEVYLKASPGSILIGDTKIKEYEENYNNLMVKKDTMNLLLELFEDIDVKELI